MRMVYVTNAAKGTNSTEYVERRKHLFKDEGYNYTELDLDGKNPKELREALRGAGIIFVEGGNTFYLLKSVRESGFDKVLLICLMLVLFTWVQVPGAILRARR